MVDFINQIIKFQNVNIDVKPIYILHKKEFSQILICEEIQTKNLFCIKALFSDKDDIYLLNSIKTEIFLLQKMRNQKNIVQMYDLTWFQINNCIYYLILMEYCKYHTLLEYIDKNKILDDSIVVSIIYQIAVGLKALHSLNYYHRDLSLENILLRNKTDKDIEIALCDFGSATNQTYSNEKIKNMFNTNLMNDFLFDLCSKTNMIYRAPEEIFIHSNYSISEKVDIYSLGIISVILLFSYIPPNYCNFHLLMHSSKKIRVQIISEIYNLCNPCFTELLDRIFSTDPMERFTIDEIINFLILNQNRIMQINQGFSHKKEKILFKNEYIKTLYEFEEQAMSNNEYSIKVFTRRILHGKFLNEEGLCSLPDANYIDYIIDMIKQEPNQIIEFYTNLFSSNAFFYNIFSLKCVFDLHYFVINFNNKDKIKFPNNIDIICPKEMDVLIHLENLNKFLNLKMNKKSKIKDEFLKDININEFIVKYIKFINKKIQLMKTYPLLISTDNTINLKKSDEILSQNFIFEIWLLFYLCCDIITLVPFQNKEISQILDSISDLLNQEIVSLCSILLIQLIVLKKQNKNFDFFSGFMDKVKKTSEYFKTLEANRKEINSKFKIINFLKSKNPDKKLKALLKVISDDITYDENFDVNKCFNPKSNFWKKIDFIPAKVNYFDENKFNNNDNDNDNEILDLNDDITNLNINDSSINIDNDSLFEDYNLFNKKYFSKNTEKKENKLDSKKSDQNQSILNSFSSTLSVSNISNSNIHKKYPHKNKLQLFQKDKNKLITKEIKDFLKSEFSKPMLHFIIEPNYLKDSNKLIGLGATSEVYQGTYKGCDVSIKKIKFKELNDNPSKAYQNEISVLTSIKHRNIVTLIGTMAEEKENQLYIITEYCQGGSLFDLLHKKKNIEIPWNLRLKFLIEISEAMNFLHKNEPQIIHRDLKSLNILLTHQLLEKHSNDHVSIKICDFGLSQIMSKEYKNFNLNGVGSVQWMAPELLQNYNSDNITDKVDVYSFGIIIWEMYSRTQPYKGMSVSQIINFVCNEKGRPNCDLIAKDDMPKGLFELMTKCWDKNPSSRPTFEEILEILNETCGVI